MNKFLEWLLTDGLASGIGTSTLLGIVIIFLFKKEPFKVFAYFREEKTKNIEQALALYESDATSSTYKELIKEFIEKSSFQKFYKIRANRKERKALLNFYEEHQSSISWSDLRRAISFMKFEGEKLSIVIKTRHIVERWSVSFISWSLIIASVVIYLLANIDLLVNHTGGMAFVRMVSLAILFLIPALMFGSLNFSYHSARKIQKIVNEGKLERGSSEVGSISDYSKEIKDFSGDPDFTKFESTRDEFTKDMVSS